MTAAYNEFIRQYKMTGSEKADGYSRNVFVGLDEGEKEEVFGILLTEIPYSAKWLFFLDAERALPIIKGKEEMWRGDKYKHIYILQEILIDYTGDLSYQVRMIEDYPTYADYLRAYVVDAVGRTPVNASQVDFLRQVILTETDTGAVARAARHFLDAVKLPRVTDEDKVRYSRLVTNLRSNNTAVKEKALGEIRKYELAVLSGDGTS